MSAAAYRETVAAQRLAADPARSAFVAANAGAGKTSVLTDRVARLLLSGARPERILCITFTKAAAAEMASRLFALLGTWALADDRALSAALDGLEGVARRREAEALAKARRLFAQALETPGGLKIQTIHSFCEGLLKRFPLEAGVPPGFAVIDESAAAGLARAAIDETGREAARDESVRAAFARLSLRFQPESSREGAQKTLRSLIADALASRGKLDEALAAARGWDALRGAVAKALGVRSGETAEDIIAAALAAIRDSDIKRAQSAMRAGEKTCRGFAENEFGAFFATAEPNIRFDLLSAVLLTQKGTPRAKFPDKATKEADPWIEGFIGDLQASFLDARERMKAAENFADTTALLAVLERVLQTYERLKAARAGLDYDDLIDGARRLFAEADLDWVRYKLDQGLDHILLDEAQDTSPAQWKVVEGPLGEFFAGAGARDGARTFFAVGDQKQSIYSFQGADAGLFKEKREDLGKKIAAVAPFENVALRLSFRSTAPVLDFVDALFADKDVLDGVSDDDPLKHELNRAGEAGLVELWPLAPRAEKTPVRAWDAPLDSKSPDNPARRLALEVAGRIRGFLDSSERLASKGRPIRAGDVMILVQSRGPLFHEVIRALTEKGVAVAGADKLQLLDDAAVEDLLSYARAALLEADDLSLAEVLKSPFFNFDDDADLFPLAYGRKGTLWRALSERADERSEWRAARAEIAIARSIGLKDGAFAFFSHLLETGAPSGRKRLYSRLGDVAAEPIAELLRQALDYERKRPRSLQGFLVWAESNAGEIKRDLAETSEAVRVMTVHGAKGLEAEIVFLLDAHRAPNLKLGPLFYVNGARAPVPILAANKDSDGAVAGAARDEARRLAYEEYRRLLYVAATRARDRLYICGVEHGRNGDPHKKPTPEKTWHALAEDAFARLGGETKEAGETSWGGAIRRIDCAQTAPVKEAKREAAPAAPPPPAWLEAPARIEAPPLRLAPSRLADDAKAQGETAAFSPSRPVEAFLRGRVLHRLLELLPEIPPAERQAAAEKLLGRLAPETGATEGARWVEEALAVIADPAFAPAFGENSRAEVAIAGRPKGAKAGLVISGQIDRLVVERGRVLIVDYKTNRPPPRRLEETPEAYVAQLAAYRALLHEIYPNKSIEAGLLWTFEARLTAIPAAMLDHAFARFLA